MYHILEQVILGKEDKGCILLPRYCKYSVRILVQVPYINCLTQKMQS